VTEAATKNAHQGHGLEKTPVKTQPNPGKQPAKAPITPRIMPNEGDALGIRRRSHRKTSGDGVGIPLVSVYVPIGLAFFPLISARNFT
jgi:hypothetical protein